MGKTKILTTQAFLSPLKVSRECKKITFIRSGVSFTCRLIDPHPLSQKNIEKGIELDQTPSSLLGRGIKSGGETESS